jgi:hypothetical protein
MMIPLKTLKQLKTALGVLRDTGEKYRGSKVYEIPTKAIMRDPVNFNYKEMRKLDYHKKTVNAIRRAIRQGKKKEIPPIHVYPFSHPYASYTVVGSSTPHHNLGKPVWKKHKAKSFQHFIVKDGHHRLTGHQAQGEKTIRAILSRYSPGSEQ